MSILSEFAAANAHRDIVVLFDMSLLSKAVSFKMYNTLSNNQGQDTGIYYGTLKKLLSLMQIIKSLPIKNVVGVYDKNMSATHKKMYKDYKANRNVQYKRNMYDDDFPVAYDRQRQLTIQTMQALGYDTFMYDRTEGDAVLAYIIKRLFEDYIDKYSFIIVSRDHDIAQLLAFEHRIIILDPISKNFYNKSNYQQFININIPIAYITIARALFGDKSDNIAGVKGFGPKYTEKLINELYETYKYDPIVRGVDTFIQTIKTTKVSALTDKKRFKLISAANDIRTFYKMTDLSNSELMLEPHVITDMHEKIREMHLRDLRLMDRNHRLNAAKRILEQEQVRMLLELYHGAI